MTEATIKDLKLSASNVRSTVDKKSEGFKELVASIKTNGLINPLTVIRNGDSTHYEIIAGNRRLEALKQLVKDGDLDSTSPIQINIVESEQAEEVSLAENFARTPMTTAETLRAFVAIRNKAATPVPVLAQRFGISIKRAERILRLGDLADPIFKAFEEGKIDEDVAQAFASTADNKLQLAAWKKFQKLPSYEQYGRSVRNLLGLSDWTLTNKLKIVGRAAYKKAGGLLENDLFSDSINILNPEILSTLYDELLDKRTQTIIDRCNREVETSDTEDYMNRIAVVYDPTKAQEKQWDKAEEQREALETEFQESDMSHSAWKKKLEPIEKKLDGLKAKMKISLPEGGRIAVVRSHKVDTPFFFWLEKPDAEPAEDEAPAEDSTISVSQRAIDEMATMRAHRLTSMVDSCKEPKLPDAMLELLVFITARQQFGEERYSSGVRGYSAVSHHSDLGSPDWLTEADREKAWKMFKKDKRGANEIAALIIPRLAQHHIAKDDADYIDFVSDFVPPLPWQSDEEFWSMFRKAQITDMLNEIDPEIMPLLGDRKQKELREHAHDLFTAREKLAWKQLSKEQIAKVEAWVPSWIRMKKERDA